MEAGNGNHKTKPINKFFKSHWTGIDNKELKMQLIRQIFSVSEINTNHENFKVSTSIVFSPQDYTSLNTHISYMCVCIDDQVSEKQIKPGFLDQQRHTASTAYHQMHEKQREHLRLSKFLLIQSPSSRTQSSTNSWKIFKTMINLTSPHYKSSCVLNSLPLISLVWLVISWNSYSCKIWQDNITEPWNTWTFYSTNCHSTKFSTTMKFQYPTQGTKVPSTLKLVVFDNNYYAKITTEEGKIFKVLPLPPLHITALESPTFATSKRSPTRIAVEAVDPASLFWLFSDFRNSESVWLYASAAGTGN